MGKPLPPGRFGRHELGIALVLCLMGLVPGVLYLIWALPRAAAYGRELAAIERQWQRAGSPDPVDPAFVALMSH